MIRSGVLPPAACIARIQAAVWAGVHGGDLPEDLLEAVGSTEAAERWRTAIAEPPSPRHRVLTALVVGAFCYGLYTLLTLMLDGFSSIGFHHKRSCQRSPSRRPTTV